MEFTRRLMLVLMLFATMMAFLAASCTKDDNNNAGSVDSFQVITCSGTATWLHSGDAINFATLTAGCDSFQVTTPCQTGWVHSGQAIGAEYFTCLQDSFQVTTPCATGWIHAGDAIGAEYFDCLGSSQPFTGLVAAENGTPIVGAEMYFDATNHASTGADGRYSLTPTVVPANLTMMASGMVSQTWYGLLRGVDFEADASTPLAIVETTTVNFRAWYLQLGKADCIMRLMSTAGPYTIPLYFSAGTLETLATLSGVPYGPQQFFVMMDDGTDPYVGVSGPFDITGPIAAETESIRVMEGRRGLDASDSLAFYGIIPPAGFLRSYTVTAYADSGAVPFFYFDRSPASLPVNLLDSTLFSRYLRVWKKFFYSPDSVWGIIDHYNIEIRAEDEMGNSVVRLMRDIPTGRTGLSCRLTSEFPSVHTEMSGARPTFHLSGSGDVKVVEVLREVMGGNYQVVWRGVTTSNLMAYPDIPSAGLTPGNYLARVADYLIPGFDINNPDMVDGLLESAQSNSAPFTVSGKRALPGRFSVR